MNCIFVVEDEFDIQELLGNYLAEASYQVLAASDGVEAINLFEKEKDRIDLVLLDVMLPKIDGFGVLEVIRQSSLVPVIMLTALDDEATRHGKGQRSWSLPRRNLNFCGNFWKTRGVCLQETSFWMLCGARIISVRTEL